MRSALESFSSSFLSAFFYPCELLLLCLSVFIQLRLLLLSALSGFSRPDRRFGPQSSAPPPNHSVPTPPLLFRAHLFLLFLLVKFPGNLFYLGRRPSRHRNGRRDPTDQFKQHVSTDGRSEVRGKSTVRCPAADSGPLVSN